MNIGHFMLVSLTTKYMDFIGKFRLPLHVKSYKANSAVCLLGTLEIACRSVVMLFILPNFHTTYLQTLLIWWTIQIRVLYSRKTVCIVSIKPFTCSVAVIKIPSILRALIYVKTLIQNAEDPFLPNQSPRTSFLPSRLKTDSYINHFIDNIKRTF